MGGSGGFIVPNPGQGTPALPENPLFHLVPLRFGKQNVVPSFEQQYGPIREVRFKFKPDGTRDGGVHQLWVVTGITTDPTLTSCSLTQPDFASQLKAGNLSFRIPLQMLGLGLIDSIQDREILSHFNATASQRAALGITGHPNRSGNDGTITRFGWKAQNKSITMFAAEAYNVEMGITNELFPTATEEDPGCQGPEKPEPNDVTRTQNDDVGPPANQSFFNPIHILADWMQFTLLMRFTDGPQPDPYPSASAQRGRTVFNAVGCALCHTPQMQTAPVMNSAVLENRPVNLFSDLRAQGSPTTSSRAQPGRTNSGPCRCGASDSGCSSSMTGGRTTSCKRSSSISRPRPPRPPRTRRIRRPRRTPWCRNSAASRKRTSRPFSISCGRSE